VSRVAAGRASGHSACKVFSYKMLWTWPRGQVGFLSLWRLRGSHASHRQSVVPSVRRLTLPFGSRLNDGRARARERAATPCIVVSAPFARARTERIVDQRHARDVRAVRACANGTAPPTMRILDCGADRKGL